MAGLWVCPHCQYRFEDDAALKRHMEEGRGCPESGARR